MNYRLTCVAAVAAVLFGSAPVMAADYWSAWSSPAPTAPANQAPALGVAPALPPAAAPTEVPAPANDPAYVRTAQYTTVSAPSQPLLDGLRGDHRWPAMERCINSANPAEFNACLASAFMQDGTGSSLSLLPRRR